ncbi:MAG: hypothetical protein IJY21_01720, partial [Clostridia bacterium]|nr:hypothetical protein [Clostridia bacterium]
MADTYLEYDYLPEKKQRRRALRKRPRWPFVLLGFFIGFITLPALIALSVFLIVSRPVEKTVNTIDKMTNVGLYEKLFGSDDKVGVLDDRYGEMSLTEALNDIIKIAEKGSELTFEDLSAISPQVEQSIDKLIESAEEKSIILDKVEVMTTPLNQFSDLLMDEVKEVELGEVLLATKSDIFDDGQTGAILKNLFFGKAGVNYTVIEGKIKMLPISYVYNNENDTFACVDETVYTKNGEVWTTENSDNYIAVLGESFALYSSYGDVIYQLQSSQEKSLAKYTAVTVNAEGLIEEVKQKSLALGAFMGKNSDPMEIVGKLELGTLLGITTKAQAEDDGNKMLVSLAYGAYDVDFEYDGESDDSRIIYKDGGKAFTTLGDLMSSPDQVLNGMQLGSLLGITTKTDAEKDSNAMLVALAYGTYGVDFEYDANDNIIAKDGGKAFTTLGDLINSPDEILNGIQLGSLLGITTKTGAEKDG